VLIPGRGERSYQQQKVCLRQEKEKDYTRECVGISRGGR
jgi:hypothetical protein